MKVIIKALKAPWPEGAKVGDVVEVPGDMIPGWAAGKCVPESSPQMVTQPDADLELLTKGLEAASAEIALLQEQLAAVTAERDSALTELAAVKEQLAAGGKRAR